MRIIGFKSDDDGSMVSVADGKLEFSFEEEKDFRRRSGEVSLPAFLRSFDRVSGPPDVFARSSRRGPAETERGTEPHARTLRHAFGRPLEWFHSTHERTQLFGSYALSPFPSGTACYALVWERHIGGFYRIDERMQIQRCPTVLAGPGRRYGYLHYLADPSPAPIGDRDAEARRADKVRALAARARQSPATPAGRALLDRLLDPRVESSAQLNDLLAADPAQFLPGSPFVRCGLHAPELPDLARQLSDELFARFHDFAAAHLREKLPLLIAGGCGLHSEWNARWRDSGLFADVFVPPCVTDGGSAIGAAAEAQYALTGDAKIAWSVYAGDEFVDDWPGLFGWVSSPLNLATVAAFLAEGRVVAWVQGRCAIGPRTLGHRSLLAAPSAPAALALNRLKDRAADHPLASVCLREDAPRHFQGPPDNPHALYAQRVIAPDLAAVTQPDGFARVQTVTPEDDARLHALLTAFKATTGSGLLGHTALDFEGRGVINCTTDLIGFVQRHHLDVAVVNDRLFVRASLHRERTGLAP